MRLNVIRADDSITHLALSGRLDIAGTTEIQEEFLQQTTWVPKNTMVDLSEVSFIASFGISMLVSAAKAIERKGAKMVLLDPKPGVKQALEISGLHGIIPIVKAADAASAELFRTARGA